LCHASVVYAEVLKLINYNFLQEPFTGLVIFVSDVVCTRSLYEILA